MFTEKNIVQHWVQFGHGCKNFVAHQNLSGLPEEASATVSDCCVAVVNKIY